MKKILTIMLAMCISVCAGAADFAIKKNGELHWLSKGEKLAAGSELATRFGLTLGNIVHNGNTLTLTNVEATFDEIRVSGESETYIELVGRTTLTTSGTGITIGVNDESSSSNVTIMGKSKNSSLTIKGASGADNANGIHQYNRGILTIMNTDLTIDVPLLSISHTRGPLVFRNTNTKLINSTHNLFTVYSSQISMSGCQLQGNTMLWDGAFRETVDGILTQSKSDILIVEDKYDVKVAGTYISARNKNDVLYDANGAEKGSVSYDEETKTLTLCNANIKHSGTAIEADTKLTILASGTNYVTSTNGRGIVTYSHLGFKSEDGGYITVQAYHEPLVHNTSKGLPGGLSFKDCNVALNSEYNDVFISYSTPTFSGCWSTIPKGFTYNTSTRTLNHFGKPIKQFVVETGEDKKGFEFKEGSLKAESVTDASVTLTWEAENNNTDRIVYEVYQDGKKIKDYLYDTSYTVTGLTPGTKYNFQILGRCYKVLRTEVKSVTTLPEEDFRIWVLGTRVTSANCDNIPFNGTGRISYDPAAQQLTLDGVTYNESTSSSEPFIFTDLPALLIMANGENKVTFNISSASNLHAIQSAGSVEISGNGYLKSSLTFNEAINSKGRSIIMCDEKLSIINVSLRATMIVGNEESTLKIEKSKVHARISNIMHCDMEDEYVKTPADLQWSDNVHGFVRASSPATAYTGVIDIMPVPVYVGGVKVTPANADDIKSQYIQWGKVSFDFETNTLHLDGAKINTAPMPGDEMSAGIYVLTDLNINVTGSTSVNQSTETGYGLVGIASDITITGGELYFPEYHSRAIVLSDMRRGCKVTLKDAGVMVTSCEHMEHGGYLIETDYSEFVCDHSYFLVTGMFYDMDREVYSGPDFTLKDCIYWPSNSRPGFRIEPDDNNESVINKGDMNEDGKLSVQDLILYIEAFNASTSYDAALDINEDGIISQEDVDALADSILK